MAKDSVRDFDATAANNTDIQSVDIAENCAPSGINNAIRELMADIKDVSAGTVALESPQADSLTVTGDLTVDTNTLYVDSTNNNVGIGTTSVGADLHVVAGAAGDSVCKLVDNGGFGFNFIPRVGGSGAVNEIRTGAGESISIATSNLERMRIDSSGNLLVGTTDLTQFNNSGTGNDDGVVIAGTAYIDIGRQDNPMLYLNRTNSSGDIISLSKDGTEIGTLGVFGGNTLIIDGTASVYFANNVRPNAQDTHDLGAASYRWRDIYTVGAVNTSDQNEKQQISELTATELAAAKRISALFKTFKWNNAVEAKGDNARIHAGIIAQDVKSALEAEGLDASKYSFWCSDTWWEHDVEVPAVEAVEAQDAVLDEDGNVVTEAVEAVEAEDAYTRRDVYETAEEAPEGAVEVTLQSVRYNELMAFVGAATEQRLTSIEARLTALEA